MFVSNGGGGGDAGFGNGGLDGSREQLRRVFFGNVGSPKTAEAVETVPAGVNRAKKTGGVHLCLAQPHELPRDAGPETIPVFGIDTALCPDEALAGDRWTFWALRLARAGRAGVFSNHAVDAVRALMGPDFAVSVLRPALVCPAAPRPSSRAILRLRGSVLDTAKWADTRPIDAPPAAPTVTDDLFEGSDPSDLASEPVPAWRKTPRYRLGTVRKHATLVYREALRDLLPLPLARLVSQTAGAGHRSARRILAAIVQAKNAGPTGLAQAPGWQVGDVDVPVGGGVVVVFAAVLGALDQGWEDLLSAFVATCKGDGQATLVIKTGELDADTGVGYADFVRRLGPFTCRIVILAGDIEGGLDQLIGASDFYACASHGEAAPLPLMRFLAAGRPAVSPSHSALADFVDPASSFVVESSIEYAAYPGDVEQRLRATRWRPDWESLCRGLVDARALRGSPTAYQARASATAAGMARLCDPDVVQTALATLVAQPSRQGAQPAALVAA